MVGLIDELRMDENFVLDLVEFKTRQNQSLPSKSQKLTHHIQVYVYEKLFNDFVRGSVTKELILKHFPLDFTKSFGTSTQGMLGETDLVNCTNLDDLWTGVVERCEAVPCISRTLIEYCNQKDQSTIAIEEVAHSDALTDKTEHLMQFWLGQRPVRIVQQMQNTFT